MTLRIRALALLLALVAAPLPAQLVGTLPNESPYTDAGGRHILALYLGYLSGVDDPAGVGPKGAAMIAGTYDYDFPGAFFLTTRMGIVPSAKRTVIDPLFDGPARTAGTRTDALLMIDFGLGASLTGEKAWHGVSPRVVTSFGYIGTANPDYDIGQYRFGSKFNVALGLNLRGVTGKDWEWRADLTRNFYRMNYPSLYRDNPALGGDPVLSGNRLNPWAGQTVLAIGIARVWGR